MLTLYKLQLGEAVNNRQYHTSLLPPSRHNSQALLQSTEINYDITFNVNAQSSLNLRTQPIVIADYDDQDEGEREVEPGGISSHRNPEDCGDRGDVKTENPPETDAVVTDVTVETGFAETMCGQALRSTFSDVESAHEATEELLMEIVASIATKGSYCMLL